MVLQIGIVTSPLPGHEDASSMLRAVNGNANLSLTCQYLDEQTMLGATRRIPTAGGLQRERLDCVI